MIRHATEAYSKSISGFVYSFLSRDLKDLLFGEQCVKIKILSVLIAIVAAASCACHAGAVKTGGTYEVLLDSANTRGGLSAGGSYTVLSSIGQRTSNGSVTTSTYTLVSGMMGAVDTTAPSVTVTSPVSAQVASGTISMVGTAFDRNGIEWKLCVGGGSNPTAWEQVGSGTGNQAASYTFGNWDSSRYSGDYTYKLVAVDGHGNTAEGRVTFNVHYTFTISGTVPAFKWIFMGVPVGVSSVDPIALFGTGSEYKVYKWDPTAAPNEYTSQYRYPSVLAAGDGFWIRVYYSDMNYSYQGSPVETNTSYTIALKSGWNMVSSPYNDDFQWGSVKVESGGTTYSLTDAATAGLIDATFYTYDMTGKTWVQNGTSSKMAPQIGCYVNAYQDLNLVFDPSNRSFDSRLLARPVVDYRINISAAARESADPYNYIGATGGSDDEFDQYDSKEPPMSLDAIEGKRTTLYFPRESWKKNAGRYTNDIRPTSKVGETESWTFDVETNEIGENVELKWDSALPTDRFRFALTNLDSGEVIDMGAQSSYTYTAAGEGTSKASFRIDAVKLDLGTISMSTTLKPGWNLIAIPLEFHETSAESQIGESLKKKVEAVQYNEGKYYNAASDEGVDFQAGIGYWLYAEEETTVDFHGLTIDDASSVEVPLEPGFNTIGSPFGSVMTFGDNIAVVSDGSEMKLSEAVSGGVLDGELFGYDPAGKTYVKTVLQGTMEPWAGYFIKANKSCTIKLKK